MHLIICHQQLFLRIHPTKNKNMFFLGDRPIPMMSPNYYCGCAVFQVDRLTLKIWTLHYHSHQNEIIFIYGNGAENQHKISFKKKPTIFGSTLP